MSGRRNFIKKSSLGITYIGLGNFLNTEPLGSSGSEDNFQDKVSQDLFTITESDEWRPIDTSDLIVKEGTVLDFTRFNEPGPAGKHGRVIRRPDGQFAFAGKPDQPVRFFCVNIANSLPDVQDIEPLAAACRRQAGE